MPDLNPPETGACPFCNPDATRHNLLLEGRDFYLIADHAPIADAHILLIPREHYPHLAALPVHLHEEFESLKALLAGFVQTHYGSLLFWENGVFGQSVPHAHLHAISLSFDPQIYTSEGLAFSGIAGLSQRHAASGGHYFAIEQDGQGHLLPPDLELYLRIIRFARDSRPSHWHHDRDERQRRGGPLVEALIQRWRREMGSAPG